MKTIASAVGVCVFALLFAICANAQTADFSKPTYVMFGGAYNQFNGPNAFAAAIVPEGQSGMYGSAVVDMFPQRYVDAQGRAGYVISGSVRVGQHREIYRTPSNAVLLGGDLGPTFSQQPFAVAIGGTNIGFSGSFTLTYVHMFKEHVGIAVPIRALYMSGVGPNGTGAWNPVAEVGIVFKP